MGGSAQETEHDMLGNLAELITDAQPALLLAELKTSLQRAFLDAEAFKAKFEPYMHMVLENHHVSIQAMEKEVRPPPLSLKSFSVCFAVARALDSLGTYHDSTQELRALSSVRSAPD
jgi:hypothetical protein